MAKQNRYVFWTQAALLDLSNKLEYRLQSDALRRRAPGLEDGFLDDPRLKDFQRAALTWVCAMPSRGKWFDAPLLAEFEAKQHKAIDLEPTPQLASILMVHYMREVGAQLAMIETDGVLDPHGFGLNVAATQERLQVLTNSLLLWMSAPQMIHRCEWCLFTFVGRADARYCGPNCRTHAAEYRAEKQMDVWAEEDAEQRAAQEADDD